MDQDLIRRGGVVPSFAFAFNSPSFSDRFLRLEITAIDSLPGSSGVDDAGSLADSARHRKRSRLELREDKDSARHLLDTPNPNGNEVETKDCHLSEEDQNELGSLTEEHLPSIGEDGDEGHLDTSPSMMGTPALRVKSIPVSSVILAASSPFFRKLFTNGMQESNQKSVTIRIMETEEEAMLELLSFMYSGELKTNDPILLLDILMVADKFEVTTCITHCTELLSRLPMSKDYALLYLDHPCSHSVAVALEPVKAAAKEFLANKYKHFLRFQDEVMRLPLSGIEAIFSSSDLQVPSEDHVYNFLLRWAIAQYPDAKECRKILNTSLFPLLRFSHLSYLKLQKVLAFMGLDRNEQASNVISSLLYKADASYRQNCLAADGVAPRKYEERSYSCRPLKVIVFDRPFLQCMAYLDLKIDECFQLFPSGCALSQEFCFAAHGFFLKACCMMEQQSMTHRFGLYLGLLNRGPMPVTLDCEFAARERPSGGFVVKSKYTHTFTDCGHSFGSRDLLNSLDGVDC
ncbi:hypothetical protein BRADI_4g33580v3 [Brachypodium distachyon]|uniref:BTB domain-containing protein n=2 Tax=Brachypodium distachyon TaxID=15368 RepID=I1IR77_BRADI|nr:hypothetical protein BRADI_4g33580v3 [Brachypodium distachyon]